MDDGSGGEREFPAIGIRDEGILSLEILRLDEDSEIAGIDSVLRPVSFFGRTDEHQFLLHLGFAVRHLFLEDERLADTESAKQHHDNDAGAQDGIIVYFS